MRHAPVSRSVALVACALACWAAYGLAPLRAAAQCNDTHLSGLLSGEHTFRVRAMAATALGSCSPSTTITAALVGALEDAEAAVRAAAAASLGRVGDGAAAAPLRALASDPESAVRNAARDAIAAIEARGPVDVGGSASSSAGSAGSAGSTGPSGGRVSYYVGIGAGAGLTGTALSAARSFFLATLRASAGVDVAPDGETPAQTSTVLSSRHLAGFYLDWSVSVTDSEAGLRCRVTAILQDYPGRDFRAMPSGAATAVGEHDVSRARTCIESAITTALGSARRAMGP